MYPTSKLALTLALITFTISACSQGLAPEEINGTAAAMAATMIVETAAALPTNTATPLPPTSTFTPTPTYTPTVTPTPTEPLTPTITPTATRNPDGMKYFLLIPDTGGSVGCGDTLAFINTGISPTEDPTSNIRIVFNALFAPKGEYYAGLYNPMHGSSITLNDIFFDSDSNEYIVDSSGYIERGEKGCRWDQIRAIVKTTMNNIPGVSRVEIKLNGKPFNDWVSKDK